MPISPPQVTSNANSKMLQIERIAADRTRPTPERMVEIAALCADFRAAVEGCTADPFRVAGGVNGDRVVPASVARDTPVPATSCASR